MTSYRDGWKVNMQLCAAQLRLESVIEECAVVFFIPFLMVMFDDEPVEEVPFVVSICATAPFVRCDTGVLTGAFDILSLVVGSPTPQQQLLVE
mmetsp:Transcript_11403/g.31851  ORF Transcript_11403/g.31851 Transcript_11403/m.31851 type:complete len:93 (-) Transcript_11403:696-974(-)